MLRDVKHEVNDGLLGLSTEKGEGVHIKIGVSPIETEKMLTINGSLTASKIRNQLGDCPLADSVMDSVENGSSKIHCILVKASTDGSIGTITKAVEGTADLSITGTPYNSFGVVVKITGRGGLNTALFRVSTDGGYTFTDELTVPQGGKYSIEDTGLDITFTADDGQSFEVGDTFTCQTVAPQMTNGDVLTALEKLKYLTEEYEFVHIVGESTADLWAAVSAQQVILEKQYHKQIFILMEAYKKRDSESLEEYISRLIEDRKSVKNFHMQIVAARSLYVGMDGITRDINNAGIVAGLYAKTKVCQSIGETSKFAIGTDKMIQLLPEGVEEFLSDLDDNNYLTFRDYDGLDGFFVTNARMMSPEGSDYRYAENVRVLDKIIKKTRKQALLQLQKDIDIENQTTELAAIAKIIKSAADEMVDAKEISSVEIEVPDGQDVLTTESLHFIIRYVPRGTFREIVIEIGVRNPNAA